ncbi:MAG: AAA family ATPase [Anaerolineaceae bacterium]|nr:AAA family ATPase [Anaerolineaceae bacterium]
MDAIRITNLRSLEDTGFIDLKPITILVGQNSSGKSTFLRTFPLLRQSIEERTTGPILWYGRYVDFGSFSESVNTNTKLKEISFGFRFSISPDIRQRNYYINRTNKNDRNEAMRIEALVTIQNNKLREEGFVSNINIIVDDKDTYYVKTEPDGNVLELFVNNKNLSQYISSSHFSMNTLFPVIRFDPTLDLKEILDDKAVFEAIDNENITRSKRNRILRLFDALSHMSYEQFELYSDINFADGGTDNVLTLMDELKIKLTPDQAEQILSFTKLSKFTSILRDIQYYISAFSKACTYIAPVRATAERFYRPQNLSVDDVDFQGKNLAVFLRSLTTTEMKDFNKWTEKHFNFTAHVHVSEGQLTITVKEGGIGHNLADTGFGYSQVLPIVTQLWSLVTSSKQIRRGIPTVFSIEQPELHLHPRMQAKLADALVDAVRMSKSEHLELRLIIETHSETIVNRLGHKIMQGEIDPKFINIAIFDKNDPNQPTKVTVGEFDNDGFLTNWPYGFFEPECED